ncbi:MAG TPA: Ig-like domain-containing protein [Planctomycetota bacterium]|nr:Ig-like domain-containing protein [Planctomycetota bacterium]HRR82802.1 Ig-like domain-containing protein [Planctomycetota bacterium]
MKHLGVVVVAAALAVSRAPAAEKKADFDPDLPPCVVRTEPADRAKEVDFALREIKVTFDRPMTTEKAWSWMLMTECGVYPGYRGGTAEPRWEDDGRTCVLPVRLSPDTVYAVGVNSPRNWGFRDTKGKAAVPFAWVFKTKRATGQRGDL